MMADSFGVSHSIEHFKKHLEQDVRPDGRQLGAFRNTSVNIGSITTADGSSLIKQGDTTVICGIKAEIALPKAELPKDGFIVPNVELPPLCSPQFKSGPPSDLAQVTSKLLDNIIQSSRCIDLEDLCIVEGKNVWVLYCDLVCLDFGGNITDVCVTALMAALRNVTLPEVSEDSETGKLTVNMDKRSRLNLKSDPVSTTFAIFDDKILFVDPNKEEESIASGTVTIVTLSSGTICNTFKPGGSALTESQLQDCITSSLNRTKSVNRLIDESILSVDR